MLHSRRVRRYQEFLKTLRRPEPRLCLCPFHLHPRPWVPPPCRTSRPHGEPSLLLSRRFHSNPELLAHSSHIGGMERRSLSQKDKAQHSRYIERLHHEEDLIKEAQRRVRNGDPLPKDMYNTVMKWSKMSPKPEEETRGAGQKKGRKQQTSQSGRKKETSEREFEKEEEELRQELKNARELNQHNIYLLEENKRLMKKIQKLRQRAKRQGETRRGSRESVEVPRQDDVILSLKKKYEDLLQYVLKVEAENQKLNSLVGAPGEGRGTDTESTRRTLTELQEETQALRQQLMEKDENLMKYEEQLKAMKDSIIILQEALKKQRQGGSRSPETAMLEEEWMRRFNETREMYEEAIQGYKDQLEQTQRKVVMDEQDHAQQIEELRKQLQKAQTQLKTKERNTLEEAKVMEEEQDHAREGEEMADHFQQTKSQQDAHKNQLQHENEELQRKLRTRNKKIETLQKQNEDQQRQNEKLLHQCSLLESQMASTRTTEQLGILSGLPQKVQEAEQQLVDTKELLHKAQVENQRLQSQLKHLEEKLGKKESKLKAEREQSLSREKEAAGARESVSSLQHQLEEMTREMNQLCEQLSTKDVILEHTSAQLEERIRECASLSALADRYKLQQNQDSDRIQTQLNERETASHKQLLEAQTQASRYQAQVAALRMEKEHTEKSLRCTVRKLEEQVDQLQLRNSTLQRQLTTFTSTYHNLFSSVDLQSVTSPAIGTTGLKGI
ncbi:hypothetical protein O3P69_009974 [Scylla paramamosain]|uniref:Uncharacterized protein n=1 Tax=Scylla paramamosain TaxID=85552 RepID=A0AAW0SPS8_SCYPA